MLPALAAATTAAAQRVAAAGAEVRSVLVVEGDSDRSALEALAARLGRNLEDEGAAIVPLGGGTNLRHLLRGVVASGTHAGVVGLCDVDQEASFCRQLQAAGLGEDLDRAGMERLGFFVCDADLEDELIRAIGVTAVQRVITGQGEGSSFATFRKQPAHRGRPANAQLRRFIGTRSGRKLRYGRAMVEALDLAEVPRPLAAVVARV